MDAKRQKKGKVTLLDYGTGNVRSLRNALSHLGYEIHDVNTAQDILDAERLIFPGVGAFDTAMAALKKMNVVEALQQYIREDRPFFGICLGLQLLFEGSEEGSLAGLGIVPGKVARLPNDKVPVPHIGWNGLALAGASPLFADTQSKYYFVHSFAAVPSEANLDWIHAVTDYGHRFVSVIRRGRVMATQFHPEKSSEAGLALIANFLQGNLDSDQPQQQPSTPSLSTIFNLNPTKISKRVVACLDVRSNDQGDLVVTKGDQYDVREKKDGQVRNLGKPIQLASRYFGEGADEIVFLNITSFRSCVISDFPMLKVLEGTSEEVFVPLTVGGGIRDYVDPEGRVWSAVEVAEQYFRAGADKVSIGSDAVDAAQEYLKTGIKTGKSSLETISARYGAQAVVVSVDPKRVYVKSAEETSHHTIKTTKPGPNGEEWVWFQCTVKGGREGRDFDVIQLCTACERLGAGEIMLNSIDQDGTNKGYDLELIQHVRKAISIPLIASSGAGRVEHFSEVFEATDVEAALAAGIFHRQEVPISAVKKHLASVGVEVRVDGNL